MARKKAKNLLYPILGFSLLATLGIGAYIALPTPTPIGINEVSTGAQLPKITFSHDCTSVPPTTTTINWNDPTGTIKQIELEYKVGDVKYWYSKKVDPTSTSTDLTGFIGSNHDSNPAKDKPLVLDRNTVYYAWAWYGEVNLPQSGGFMPYDCVKDPPVPVPTGLTHTCSTDGKKVSLKWDDISPSKKYYFALDDTSENSPTSWYKRDTTDVWRGGDYILSTGSYDLPVVPGRNYRWWVSTTHSGPYSKEVRSPVLTFTCLPSVTPPQNPRHTCSPDGKSVKFRWDSVEGVNSYKIRLDDKAGKVTNFDGITNTEFITTVIPGKTYAWWLHSHKDSYDSIQTGSTDFACTPTVIAATPTPTPRPSARPTVTPTPTPSPSSSIAPPVRTTTPITQTPSEPEPPSITEPTTPPVPERAGFFTRLFSWLSSLFE